jgi:hypothetical protein
MAAEQAIKPTDNPSDGPYYIPYKGNLYPADYLPGLKLLIIGDSFYTETWSPTAPTEAIEQHISGKNYDFFEEVQWRVTGSQAKDKAERRAFWDRVAFTNLVQEPMAAASAVPTRAHWRRAWACFPQIIRATEPDVIFFFTRRGWNIEEKFDSPFGGSALEQLRPEHRPEDCAYLRDFSSIRPDYRAISGCFNHPSRDKKRDEWHAWAVRLLSKAPAILRTASTTGSNIESCR